MAMDVVDDEVSVEQATMHRKRFLALAVGILVAPWRARAQSSADVSRIGLLFPEPGPSPARQRHLDVLLAALKESGWVSGKNLQIDLRWAGPDPQRQRQVAADLKRLQVAMIVTSGTTQIRAARDGAPGVPIVMINAGDAVGSGFAATLSRPGGDLTGTSAAGEDILPKQLELLSSAVPHLKKVGVLMNAANPANQFFHDALAVRAATLGLQLERIEIASATEIEAAVERARGEMLVVLGDPMFSGQRNRIVDSTLRSKVPAIYGTREFVDAGGLMSYNSSYLWHWRSAAAFIDKILKGAKPGALPIEQPVVFELVINLKAAKLLGIAIPASLLQRADELIE